MSTLPAFWLRDSLPSRLLAPLGALTGWATDGRRRAYQAGRLRAERLPVPVVVVGNIFVGGTGKTPLVAWIAAWLREQGARPGILTRGYGGASRRWPRRAGPEADPREVGDEAVLLARLTELPVAAGPDRVAAGRLLIAEGCDVLVSDDGLQHYRLARDLEFAVVDAERGLGNGRCLPAGPLRERPARLAQVDLVLSNGPARAITPFGFQLVADGLCSLTDGHRAEVSELAGTPVNAVAGIGNPGRFFASLRAQGLEVIEHPFPDHHPYRPQDLDFGDGLPVVMTAKDAVKVAPFALDHYWYQPARVELEAPARAALCEALARVLGGRT